VVVGDGAKVEESILFEGVEVGSGAWLRKCIVDKHVKIPADVRIGAEFDDTPPEFTVSAEGVTVIPRGFRFESETVPRTVVKSAPVAR
jgi:glucose-1-phosphate adenylyltransferase